MWLIPIVVGPILLLWLIASRVASIRWVTAAVVAGLAAAGAALVHFLPRATLEISLMSLVVIVFAVVVGGAVELSRHSWPVEVNTIAGHGCGAGSCTRTIDVSGRSGQSDADLRAELTRHLKARGWGTGCRPAGWLLDRGTECVELEVGHGRAKIGLYGDRDDVRRLRTLG